MEHHPERDLHRPQPRQRHHLRALQRLLPLPRPGAQLHRLRQLDRRRADLPGHSDQLPAHRRQRQGPRRPHGGLAGQRRLLLRFLHPREHQQWQLRPGLLALHRRLHDLRVGRYGPRRDIGRQGAAGGRQQPGLALLRPFLPGLDGVRGRPHEPQLLGQRHHLVGAGAPQLQLRAGGLANRGAQRRRLRGMAALWLRRPDQHGGGPLDQRWGFLHPGDQPAQQRHQPLRRAGLQQLRPRRAQGQPRRRHPLPALAADRRRPGRLPARGLSLRPRRPQHRRRDQRLLPPLLRPRRDVGTGGPAQRRRRADRPVLPQRGRERRQRRRRHLVRPPAGPGRQLPL